MQEFHYTEICKKNTGVDWFVPKADAEAAIKVFTDDKIMQKTHIEHLEAALAEKDMQLDNQDSVLNDNLRLITARNAEIDDLKADRDDLNERLTAMSKTAWEKDQEVSDLKAELDRLGDELLLADEAKRENARLKEQIAALNLCKAASQELVEALTAELVSISAPYYHKWLKAQEEIKTAEDIISILQGSVKESHEQIATLTATVERLERELSEALKNQHDENCDSRDVQVSKPCNCYLIFKQEGARLREKIRKLTEENKILRGVYIVNDYRKNGPWPEVKS